MKINSVKKKLNKKKDIKKSNKKIQNAWRTWKIQLHEFFNKKDLKIIELGVFKGEATTWFLENLIHGKDSFIIAIDTFQGLPEYEETVDFTNIEDCFIENIEKTNKKENVRIMKMLSKNVLIELNNDKNNLNNFDVIFIDASHITTDVITDAILSWPLLKEGGIMIFDNYIWDKLHKSYFTPKTSIDFFLNIFKPQLKVLYIGNQVFVKKIKLEDFEVPYVSLNELEERLQKTVNNYFSKEYMSLLDYDSIKKEEKLETFNMVYSNKLDNENFDLHYFKNYFTLYIKQNSKPYINYIINFSNIYKPLYSELSHISIRNRNINILDTSYEINNINMLDCIECAKCLKIFKNYKIIKYLNLKSKAIGSSIFRTLNEGFKTSITEDIMSIETYLHNTKYINYIKENIDCKFDIVRLLPFNNIRVFSNENFIKNCLKIIYGTFIFGLNFQELNGTLILTRYEYPLEFDNNFIYFLSWAVKYYSNLKINYGHKVFHLIFEDFKGISKKELNKLNIELDNLKINDFYTEKNDHKTFSAYADFSFPIQKIDNRIFNLLNDCVKHYNLNTINLIRLTDYYNEIHMRLKNDNKLEDVSKLESLIHKYQIELFIKFINKKFILNNNITIDL